MGMTDDISFIRTALVPPQFQQLLAAGGLEFAEMEDAGSAVMHISCDTEMNGGSSVCAPSKLIARPVTGCPATVFCPSWISRSQRRD